MIAYDDPALFARINLQQDIRQLQLKLAEQLSRIRRIKGNCVISLQADAFERAGELKTMHPVDVSTSRVRVQVPLNGQLEELTQRQAEVMFEKGRRP